MNRLRQLPPYWYIIALFTLGSQFLFIRHLATGQTPSRVAFTIEAFNFNIYWYGIVIVGGIALGGYVTSRLALMRARRLFAAHVPADLAETPVGSLKLSAEITQNLEKLGYETVGDILLQWGFNPALVNVKDAERQKLQRRLKAYPGVKPLWLNDAPWRVWNPEYVWGGLGWCLVLAVIGARLYHVLTPSPSMEAVGISSAVDYFRQPLRLIDLRSGGLGIYGGIAGGALGLLLYTRRHHIPVLEWADLGAVGTALGQYFGRWGNFFNQELYGRPSDLPWAITIDANHRLDQYIDVSRFHPAFLYESLWNLGAFLLLYYLARHYDGRLKRGELTALYLIAYALGRILLEFVRLDSPTVIIGSVDLGLPIATLVSILVALSMALWAGRRRLVK